MSAHDQESVIIDHELQEKPVSSFVFLAFLLAALGLGVWMLVTQQSKMVVDKVSTYDVLEGRTAFSFEKKFEDAFPLKDTAVGTFGAFSYGVLNTGRDGVVVGKDGWFFTKEEFEALADADKAQASKIAFAKDIQRYLAAHHIGLVVAVIPSKTRVYEEYLQDGMALPESRRYTYEAFRKALSDDGIVAPDLEVVLREGKSSGAMFMHTDTHWSAAGAQRVAQALAAEVKAACPSLKLAEQTFKTERGKEKTYDGDLLRYVKTGVFRSLVGPKPEVIHEHATQSEGAADDLFGDNAVEVSLVGTSYSAQKDWHFDGFLKEALRADVLNLADEGKGPIEPMVNFLTKTDFKQAAPKLVIWEIPERFIQKTYDIALPALTVDAAQAHSVAPCRANAVKTEVK